ncbi:MAG: hypothetical protein WCH05_06510 [Chlorobiaceae bacterium]
MSNIIPPSTAITVDNIAYLLSVAGREEAGELTVQICLPLTIISGKFVDVSWFCGFINKRHSPAGKFGVDPQRRINYTVVISRTDTTHDTELIENAVQTATTLFTCYHSEITTAATTRAPYATIMEELAEKEEQSKKEDASNP